MSKRAPGLERRPNDLYRTWDFRAVAPLLPFLPTNCDFVEPCAGDGVLVDHLEAVGHKCILKSDIAPQRADIRRMSAHQLKSVPRQTLIVTNPPWTREIMHPLMKHLCRIAPTWGIWDADWLYTRQSVALLPFLRKVVAVGRVRWIEGTVVDGKDNCSWYLLDGTRPQSFIEFHGRQ